MNSCLSIFDICGTLYRSNTTHDFLEYYWSKKNNLCFRLFFKVSRTKAIKFIWIILSKVFGTDIFRILAVRTLRGEKKADVDALAHTFVKNYLPSRIRSEIFALLNEQRNSGAEIVLMSASIYPVVKAIATMLKIEQYFCSMIADEHDILLGYLSFDMHGRKKEVFLKNFDSKKKFTFVTDNKEDLPLIELSAFPYIVTRKKNMKFWKTRQPTNAHIIEVN